MGHCTVALVSLLPSKISLDHPTTHSQSLHGTAQEKLSHWYSTSGFRRLVRSSNSAYQSWVCEHYPSQLYTLLAVIEHNLLLPLGVSVLLQRLVYFDKTRYPMLLRSLKLVVVCLAILTTIHPLMIWWSISA